MASKQELKGAFARVTAVLNQGPDPSSSPAVLAAWMAAQMRAMGIAARVNDWLALPDFGPYEAAIAALNDAADALTAAADEASVLAALGLINGALSQVEGILNAN